MSSWLQSFWRPPPTNQVVLPVRHDTADPDSHHSVVRSLADLVATGGAGTWPPKATFVDSWPSSLKPYHYLYHDIAPSIPVEEASLDDARNRVIIDALRLRLRNELQYRVNLEDVRATLDACELGTGQFEFAPAAWMGFFACITSLRHAYRWGVSPVVREAQNETVVNFPEHLDVPYAVLQRRFGTTSPGGNLTSSIYYNVNDRREIEYSSTVGLPSVHRTTECWNATLFIHMEEKALPMYHLMGEAAICLDKGDSNGTLKALRSANDVLKTVLKYFYDNLTDAHVSQEHWMAYVQGFHGWVLGGIDGVSGGHSVVIRSLDAFLGIRPWPQPNIEALHIPLPQRNWLNSLRDYDIRSVANAKAEAEVVGELEGLVRQLRLWRMGHLRRMQPYEGVPRPERKKMTSGKSVVEDDIAPDEDAMLTHLSQQLRTRLSQTK